MIQRKDALHRSSQRQPCCTAASAVQLAPEASHTVPYG